VVPVLSVSGLPAPVRRFSVAVRQKPCVPRLSASFLKLFLFVLLFRSKVVRNEIKKLAQGSTRYNMSKTELLKLEILLPSIKEQKEISAFLSSLYQKIQTEKAILEQLEMQKKYLLQQMFV
jgi:type I restriction enzyme S subunit